MTYGPITKWRFPFQEKLKLRKPDLRVVFLSLCLVVLFIFSVSFTYYSSLPVTVTSNKFLHDKFHVDRVIETDVSRRTVSSSEDDDVTSDASEITTKEIEKVFSKLNLNIGLINNETSTDVTDVESGSFEADDNGNSTLASNPTRVHGIDWNDTRLDILHMVIIYLCCFFL